MTGRRLENQELQEVWDSSLDGCGMGRRVERKLLMHPGAALDTRGAGPSPWGVTREKGEGTEEQSTRAGEEETLA